MGTGSDFSMWDMERRKRKLAGDDSGQGLREEISRPNSASEQPSVQKGANPIERDESAEIRGSGIRSRSVVRPRKQMSITRTASMLPEPVKKESGLDVRQFWEAVRRQKMTILFVTLAITLINSAYVMMQHDVFRARSTLRRNDYIGDVMQRQFSVGMQGLDTEKRVIQKAPTLKRAEDLIRRWIEMPYDAKISSPEAEVVKSLTPDAREKLKGISFGQIGSMISVTSPDNNQLLEISAKSTDPTVAKFVADAVGYAFCDVQKELRINGLKRYLEDAQAKLEESSRERLESENRIKARTNILILSAIASKPPLPEIPPVLEDSLQNDTLREIRLQMKNDEERLKALSLKLRQSRESLASVNLALESAEYVVQPIVISQAERLSKYENDFLEKREKYTDKNPLFIKSRNAYRRLWASIAKDRASAEAYQARRRKEFHENKHQSVINDKMKVENRLEVLEPGSLRYQDEKRQLSNLQDVLARRRKEIANEEKRININKSIEEMAGALSAEDADWDAKKEKIKNAAKELFTIETSPLSEPLSTFKSSTLEKDKRELESFLNNYSSREDYLKSKLKGLSIIARYKTKLAQYDTDLKNKIADDPQLIRLRGDLEAKRQVEKDFYSDVHVLKKRMDRQVDIYSMDSPAQLPSTPIGPQRLSNILLGFFVGLIVSLGIVMLFEYLDETLRSPNDIRKELGLVTLGIIPKWGDKQYPHITTEDPKSVVSEVFGVLRNNIRYSSRFFPEKLLMVTSAMKGEGKSYVAQNLAQSFALEGNSTVLVNADMRKTHNYQSIRSAPGVYKGLSDFLEESASIGEVISETETPGLQVIAAGRKLEHPAKMLRSSRMLELLDELEKNYDVVIVDVPAVLPVVDTTIFSNRVRGILMVVGARETSVHTLRHAIDRLNHVKSPIIGAVLNKATDSNVISYYGSNYYYYYDEPEPIGYKGLLGK